MVATQHTAPRPRFPLGHIVATPGALAALAAAGMAPDTLLARHTAGDWGDVGAADAVEDDLSLARGFRLLSSYRAGDARIWIITEADRSATTLLLPEEY